jgi:two-component sensor histidine kinase/putative methionine-R-sulfoxide reductase with GAF domain
MPKEKSAAGAGSTLAPFDALLAFIETQAAGEDSGPSAARRAAYRLGESSAATDLTIEETFELLEREVGDALTELSADLLGSIVRGYVDQVVRTRGLTRNRGTGRLSSHVARLAALNRINRAATASLHLDDMLSTVVQVVNETIEGDACSVFLYDPSSHTLVLRATVGLNPDAIGRVGFRADAGIAGLAATSRQTQITIDAHQHPAFFTYPIVGEDPYTSQVSIPLLLREPERLVGVMSIQSRDPREFDQDEITFLETTAGELAIAIENARLYGQTDAALHQRISDLHALQAVTRALGSTLRPDELLPLIADRAIALTGADIAAVCRIEDDESDLRQLAHSPADADIDGFPREFVQAIYRNRSAMVLRPTAHAEKQSVLLGAPLMTAHEAYGAICVRIAVEQNHTDEKLGLFQLFADSAALALENAELYEEARRGYATASTLLQEMHHRVRNNLQTVAALLSMQARHATQEEASAPLLEAVARVQSIAAVHSLLSGDNFTTTTIPTVVKHVVDEASITVVPPGCRVTFIIEPSEVEVTSRQATVVALLVNECVTNAIEHGLTGRSSGEIRISASEDRGMIELRIADDGNGLPEGFGVDRDSGLGLRIARTLASTDLGGSYALERGSSGGAVSVIRFPARRYPSAAAPP